MNRSSFLNISDRVALWPVKRFIFSLSQPERYRIFVESRENRSTDARGVSAFFKKKAIFIHIPKTAGNSIAHSIFKEEFGFAHTKIRTYRILFTDDEFNQFFKFCFVRNPFDRLVSAYFYLRSGGLTKQDKQWFQNNIAKYESFQEFVKRWLTKKNIYSYYHFIPQSDFICINGKVLADFIGRYENILEDHDRICDILGVEGELAKVNVTGTRARDYRSYYDDETVDIVAQVYEEDIRRFGYGFSDVSRA